MLPFIIRNVWVQSLELKKKGDATQAEDWDDKSGVGRILPF